MLNQSLKAVALTVLLSSVSSSAFASQNLSNDAVQDAYKAGTRVKIDEDQDKVYAAVQKGLIRPFSELYTTIDNELNGRLIKVELEEDDNEWIYDLKLVHDDKVIHVEYDATTLELMSIRGRNVLSAIKQRDPQ